MFQIDLFTTPRLKPIVEKTTKRITRAQAEGIKRARVRKEVKTYFSRAEKYDVQNLALAREILAGGREWEPFYMLYARAVLTRLGTAEERGVVRAPSRYSA